MTFLGSEDAVPNRADLAIVGTGFAASFFLWELLSRAGPKLTVVVFERGGLRDHMEQIEQRTNPPINTRDLFHSTGENRKPWNFSVGFGGSSNCWTGNTPRMLPADFETNTRYRVGQDWPFGYEELEPYYVIVERLMQIAGHGGPAEMSASYPLSAHDFSEPEYMLQRAWPGQFFPMPTARASRASTGRPPCCANGVCGLCPIDAKFTILNGMQDIYDDPRVIVATDTVVQEIETEGGNARAFVWTRGGRIGRTRADHLVLAANGLFNPHILLRSGDPSALTGKRLHEQVGLTGRVYFDGLDSFQGSTYVTGIGYMLYDDESRRRDRAAALLETRSVGRLRIEAGRWRQVLPFRLVIEEMPLDENRVSLDERSPDLPIAEHNGISAYAQKALDMASEDLTRVFKDLPVEKIEIAGRAPTESHIQGTTVMGHDPKYSVVDGDGLHHHWRDLRVLGSSLFPTGAAANPTLTLSAHAVRAAARMEFS